MGWKRFGDDLEPDGVNNWMEYAQGGNPTNSDAAFILPTFEMAPGGSGMDYVYRRRTDYAARGLDYAVEVTTNLVDGTWSTSGTLLTGAEDLGTGFDAVTNRLPVADEPQQFLRLRVE